MPPSLSTEMLGAPHRGPVSPGRHRPLMWRVGLAGVFVALVGSACSSAPAPKPSPVTRLVNTNAGDGFTYTFDGPLRQITTVYGILRVAGPGALTITSSSAYVSDSQEEWVASELESTYIATVQGTFEQAYGYAFNSGGSLQQALNGFHPRLAPWDSAVHASQASLRAGPYYLVAVVFDVPDPNWALKGLDLTYRVGEGTSRTLSLRGEEIQVQTPL
jgi:hypothetical protein